LALTEEWIATRAPLIVGIGGTTRTGSSSERMVRAVLAETEGLGATTRMFGGPQLATLPHFAPDTSERTPEQLDFVEAVRAADGLVIGSPGYHGGVSGLVKNAIDLLEDLRDDTRVYFDGRAVGLVVVAAGWQGCGVTLQALRGIVHAMRGWPTPLGITVNTVEQKPFDAGEHLVDPSLRAAVRIQAEQIMLLARRGD
jgi:FMN reductase